MPALRKIVKGAASNDYSSHAIVLGIVHSYPFLNRRVDGPGVSRRPLLRLLRLLDDAR